MNQKFPNLGSVVLNRCAEQPNKKAFQVKRGGEWVWITFGEQLDIIKKVASALMESGIEKEDKVAICAQTSIEWGQFDIGILGCGAITIPLYPTNTPEDCTYILNHSEAKYIFIDSMLNLQKFLDVKNECPTVKGVVVSFNIDRSGLSIPSDLNVWHLTDFHRFGAENLEKNDQKIIDNLKGADTNDIFTICYTSGTTGVPKGVVLTHRAIKSAAEDCDEVLSQFTQEEDSLLSYLPMSHIFGKFESFLPYYFGWQQSFVENLDTILADIADTKPTVWFSVPRLFEKAYNRITATIEEGPPTKKKIFDWAIGVAYEYCDYVFKKKPVPVFVEAQYFLAKKLVFDKIKARFGGRLKFAVSGGAPLSPEIARFMFAVGVPVYEGYGLTETCAPIAVNTPANNKIGTVGLPLPEVLVKIAEDGELLVKSKKNFIGYYKDEEATKAALKEDWFYTGDIAKIDKDGFIRITDRKKDLIKTAGGKYVAPQKIENIAKTSQLLNQVVCYGDKKPYITALITLHEDAIKNYAASKGITYDSYAQLLELEEIKKYIDTEIKNLNKQLPKWETIKRYHIIDREFTVEAGELTPSLKIKRKHLTKVFESTLEGLYS